MTRRAFIDYVVGFLVGLLMGAVLWAAIDGEDAAGTIRCVVPGCEWETLATCPMVTHTRAPEWTLEEVRQRREAWAARHASEEGHTALAPPGAAPYCKHAGCPRSR